MSFIRVHLSYYNKTQCLVSLNNLLFTVLVAEKPQVIHCHDLITPFGLGLELYFGDGMSTHEWEV